METYEETLERMWIEKHIRLAREEGLEEGVKEGRKVAGQQFLLRQLARRFGALPEAVTTRVMDAGREELERCSDRILDAASLDDVFAAP
jgi:Domain of unknown function (DUF4351)